MAKRKISRLVFIFNADSGKWGAFVDSTKKVLMIKGCTLCAITHGILGEKTEWKECKEELGVPIDYLHKDEISGEMKDLVGNKLPCVLAETDGKMVMLLTPEVLDRCRGSVPDLKGKLVYHADLKDLEIPQL